VTRKLLAVLALLGLHGCNTVEDPFLDTMTNRETHTSTGNRELPVHLASASLAGLREAPLSLRQTQVAGGVQQVIVWPNTTTRPGENALTVSSLSSPSALRKGPDRAEIIRVLKREFPGLPMSIDPVIRQNAYGAYGVAASKLGESGGCVYAWQRIAPDAELGRDTATDVRLRYCHATLAPEVLADLMAGLSLHRPGSSINPPATALYGYSAHMTTTQAIAEPEKTAADPMVGTRAPAISNASTSDETKAPESTVRVPMPG
jgi:hypothetical protein